MTYKFNGVARNRASFATRALVVAFAAFAGPATRSARAELATPHVDHVLSYGGPLLYAATAGFHQGSSVGRVVVRTQTLGRTTSLPSVEEESGWIAVSTDDPIFREPDLAELWIEIDSDELGGTTSLESNHVQFSMDGFGAPPLRANRTLSAPVTLRWHYGIGDIESALNAGEYVTGYEVFRAVHGEAHFAPPPGFPVAGLRPIDDSWVDESAEPRTSYDYRIRAKFLDVGDGPIASKFSSSITLAATPPRTRLPHARGAFDLWTRPYQSYDAWPAWKLFGVADDPGAPAGSFDGSSGHLGDMELFSGSAKPDARRVEGTIWFPNAPPDEIHGTIRGRFVVQMNSDPAVRYSRFTARLRYVDPETRRTIVRKLRGEAAPFAGTNVFVDAHCSRNSLRPGDRTTFRVDVRDLGPQAAPQGALVLHIDVDGAEMISVDGVRGVASTAHDVGESGADAVLGPLGPFGGSEGALASLLVVAQVTAADGGVVRCRATVSQGTTIQWRQEPIPLPPAHEVLAVPVLAR